MPEIESRAASREHGNLDVLDRLALREPRAEKRHDEGSARAARVVALEKLQPQRATAAIARAVALQVRFDLRDELLQKLVGCSGLKVRELALGLQLRRGHLNSARAMLRQVGVRPAAAVLVAARHPLHVLRKERFEVGLVGGTAIDGRGHRAHLDAIRRCERLAEPAALTKGVVTAVTAALLVKRCEQQGVALQDGTLVGKRRVKLVLRDAQDCAAGERPARHLRVTHVRREHRLRLVAGDAQRGGGLHKLAHHALDAAVADRVGGERRRVERVQLRDRTAGHAHHGLQRVQQLVEIVARTAEQAMLAVRVILQRDRAQLSRGQRERPECREGSGDVRRAAHRAAALQCTAKLLERPDGAVDRPNERRARVEYGTDEVVARPGPRVVRVGENHKSLGLRAPRRRVEVRLARLELLDLRSLGLGPRILLLGRRLVRRSLAARHVLLLIPLCLDRLEVDRQVILAAQRVSGEGESDLRTMHLACADQHVAFELHATNGQHAGANELKELCVGPPPDIPRGFRVPPGLLEQRDRPASEVP